MRQCPKWGKKFTQNRMRCNAWPKHHVLTEEVIEWTDKDESMAVEDLEEGLAEDPLEDNEDDKDEDEDEVEVEEDLREDLKGQADQIHDLLEEFGPLTYNEIGQMIVPTVSDKRAARLISQMIRDGVELKREGSPRKVSIG